MVRSVNAVLTSLPDLSTSWLRYMTALMRSINRERTEFMDSYLIAAQIALQAAREQPMSLRDTMEIMQHKQSLVQKGLLATQGKMTDYLFDQVQEAFDALSNTIFDADGEHLTGYMKREAEVMEAVANFPEKIEKVKDDFGFHFERSAYRLVHDTGSFLMYQVLPLKKGVKVRDDLKPMLLIPPYMLGEHILSFLPYED